jgi:hypothetical protein
VTPDPVKPKDSVDVIDMLAISIATAEENERHFEFNYCTEFGKLGLLLLWRQSKSMLWFFDLLQIYLKEAWNTWDL